MTEHGGADANRRFNPGRQEATGLRRLLEARRGCARGGRNAELPPATTYAPDLNDIERTGGDLKRRHMAHRTFKNACDLACAIHAAAGQPNKKRQTTPPCDKLNTAA
jgi:hypothetical protein